MKKYLAFILLLSSGFQAFSQDSLHIVKWSNGNLKIQGILQEDTIKQGTWQTWYQNGQLRDSGRFDDNRREGYWKYIYANGILSKEGKYIGHSEEGLWVWYYENGQVDMQGSFEKGLQTGMWTYWRTTGEKEYEGVFANDKREKLWTWWFADSTLSMKGAYTNDLMEDEWNYWYQNGVLESKGKYIQDKKEDQWEYWYEDGTKWVIGSFANDKKEGRWDYWYSNGEKFQEGFFKAAKDDNSGSSVGISADGLTVAVGAVYNDGTGLGAGHVKVYFLQDLVGVADYSLTGLSVYPNPTSGRIFVRSEVKIDNIRAWDMKGRLIHSSNKNEIDLTGYETGIYLVKVMLGGKHITKKVFVR